MKHLTINVFLLLASAFVLANNIHPVEAVRVLKKHDYELPVNRDNHHITLLSTLPKGDNPPSSPNPKEPSTINGKAFAGHAMYHQHHIALLSSLQKGGNTPSSPNPTEPSSINGKAFAGHAMYHQHYIALLSSLQKGSNTPSAPNPKQPATINDRAFAGHAMHHRHPSPPRQGLFLRKS